MKMLAEKANTTKHFVAYLACMGLMLIAPDLFASQSSNMTLGSMATQITGSFAQVTKLITAGSYMAGLGFFVGAIMKFKQHKDNPTQIPIGTPIALLFIAAALLFLPTVLGITGETIFGGNQTTPGPTGTLFTTKESGS